MTGPRVAAWLARFGLVARSVFYCLLVYLVVALMVGDGHGHQANAHGALTTVASTPGGLAAIAATAVGFLAFGLTRIWGAVRDGAPSAWTRISTFLQGGFYVVLTWVPASYALGRHTTGSEQQQHATASGILSLPAGREMLFAVGAVFVGVCINQIRTGVDRQYVDGMDIDESPRWVRRLVHASGTVGIPARAMVFLPVGVCFMIAAVQSDPRHADGLDRELVALCGTPWGMGLLALVAAGLAVFAAYSFLEARYRTVTRGQ